MNRPVRVLLGTAATLAATAGTAFAAPDWSPSVPAAVPATAYGGQFESGFQDGGTLTTAFLEVPSITPIQTKLRVGAAAPGGAFSEQLGVASIQTAIPVDAHLAVAPNGAAVVAWAELTGDDLSNDPYRYKAAYRPAGSTAWEAARTIFTDAVRVAGVEPQIAVAMSADGSAAAAVRHVERDDTPSEPSPKQTDHRLDIAVRSAGGDWQATQRLSPHNQSAESVAVGFDDAGNLTIAYALRISEGGSSAENDDTATAGTQRRSASNGIFGTFEDISGSNLAFNANGPALGVGADGSAVISYQYVRNSPASLDAWVSSRSGPNGAWTAPHRIVTASSSAPGDAGVAPDGKAYVVYSMQGSGGSGGDCIGAVRAVAGGTWSAHRCISPLNESGNSPRMAFLGNDAFFGWRSFVPGDQSDNYLQAARWSAAGTQPDAARDLQPPHGQYGLTDVVADRDGSVVVLYSDAGGKPRATAFDGGAPHLSGIDVPTGAVVGQPVSVAISASDPWSPLAPGGPAWDFGDGATGAGTTAAHTFASPGTYTVTARAADARGNTATRSATIVVSAAPVAAAAAGNDAAPGQGAAQGAGGTPAKDGVKPALSLSKPAKAKRRTGSAWRTLHGTIVDAAPSSGVADVQVTLYRKAGKHVFALQGGRFRKTTKAKAAVVSVAADVKGATWSLALPELTRGTYVLAVRAHDKAGNAAKAITLTLKLR